MAKETFYYLGVRNSCLPLTYQMRVCSNKSRDFKTYLDHITQLGSYGVKQNQKVFSFIDGTNDQMLFHINVNRGNSGNILLGRWHQPDIAPVVVGDIRICKAPLAKSISVYATKYDSDGSRRDSVVFVFRLCQGCVPNCRVGNLDTSALLPTTAELQLKIGDVFKNLELTLQPGIGAHSNNCCQKTGECHNNDIVWYGVVDSKDLNASQWTKNINTNVEVSAQVTSAPPPPKKRKIAIDKLHGEINAPFTITVLSLKQSAISFVSNCALKDMRHGIIQPNMVIVSSDGVEYECHQDLLKVESSILSGMVTAEGYLTFSTDSTWDSETLQPFLTYLYQTAKTFPFHIAVKLLKFGVSYDIPRLVRKCVGYIENEVEKDLQLVKVEKALPQWSNYNGLLDLREFTQTLKKKKLYVIPMSTRQPVVELIERLELMPMVQKENELCLSRVDEPLQLAVREIRSW